MKIGDVGVWAALAAFAVAGAVFAAAPELTDVSDTVEAPGGGQPLAFSLSVPKGAQATAKLMPHIRGYGLDVSGGRVSVSLSRLSGGIGDMAGHINYKASLSGGLAEKREVEKGSFLAVMQPMAGIQTVYLFKPLSKAEQIEVECNGPPSQVETLKQVCASFKTR